MTLFFPFCRQRPRHRTPARAGFTLVEILTATAIMALVVSLVMTILSQVMTAWDASSDKLSMSGNARAVMDLMTQDLQAAVFRHDSTNTQWMALDTNDISGPDSVGASKLANNTNFSRLIFYSAAPMHQSKDNSGSGGSPSYTIYGDLCLIEYRVQFQDPFGNSALGPSTYTFILHRVVVDPATTFLGLNGHALMGLSTHSATNPIDLMTAFDSYIDITGSVNSTPPAGPSGTQLKILVNGAHTPASALLADVGQFIVTLYYYGYNSGIDPPLQAYPMSTPYNATKYYFGGSSPGNAGINNAGYLDSYSNAPNAGNFVSMAYADITLTIINEDGIALMQQNAGAMPEGMTWPQFLQLYGSTFTQRVKFQNKPE